MSLASFAPPSTSEQRHAREEFEIGCVSPMVGSGWYPRISDHVGNVAAAELLSVEPWIRVPVSSASNASTSNLTVGSSLTFSAGGIFVSASRRCRTSNADGRTRIAPFVDDSVDGFSAFGSSP